MTRRSEAEATLTGDASRGGIDSAPVFIVATTP